MKRLFLIFLFSALAALPLRADEGMWLPSLIGSRIPDMQAKGYKLTAQDIYDINQASLKDAIVRFGRGCTGELVSAEGLMLTNHHCGYGQIQSHSTVQNDYLTNGYWAQNRSEELPNPGLKVTFLVRMEDVTEGVMAGTTGLSGDALADRIEINKRSIVESAIEGTHYSAEIEALYYGNQYFLFVNEVFTDVRLVAAPPSSIGSFGGDTDNWMWPRHTGDFSIFRIYAGYDNKPAPYSKDNIPYKSKKYFTISTAGLSEGDFTMVYGFPARTTQYLHSSAVDYVLNVSNPKKIDLRTKRLEIVREAQESSPAIRIAYADKAAGIANAWKKWQGESLGLARLGTIDKKRDYETRFKEWAVSHPEYSTVVDDLAAKYAELDKYAFAYDMYIEAINCIELFTAARTVSTRMEKPTKVLPESLETFYKDYYPAIDREITKILLTDYLASSREEFIPERFLKEVKVRGGVDKYVDHLYNNSVLTNPEMLLTAAGKKKTLENLQKNDPAIIFYKDFYTLFRDDILPHYNRINGEINDLYSIYMRGMMAFEPERDFFPDANFTLRVAYGQIEGYSPEDGITCLPFSTIEGIIEKDDPEIYDYDIPQRLRELYADKDYGRWEVSGTVPVDFLATNHTTGGNSGSPVLNGNGQLIGINFDRTWLSTMSDIEFDPTMCRNIAVDIRYVLFIMDKLGNASHLIREMDIK